MDGESVCAKDWLAGLMGMASPWEVVHVNGPEGEGAGFGTAQCSHHLAGAA